MTDKERQLESWKSEFRTVYEADPENSASQSFDEYWRWVSTFLVTGAVGQRGWLDQAEAVLGRVDDRAVAKALRVRLERLGRSIAADWSKHGNRRRIHSTVFQGTPNLQAWGAQLQRAASRDPGDGSAIEQVVAAIERDVADALAL